MSRKDKKFPTHKWIYLDPLNPPRGWRDTCRRCAKCGARWPNHPAFKEMPCCGSIQIVVEGNSPDLSWANSIKKLLEYLFEKYYDKYNDNISDEVVEWVSDPLPISEEEIKEGMKDIERFLSEIEEHG